MARSLHPDAAAILARLQQEGVTSLYHFTSVENLPDICREQALLSKEKLIAKGLLSRIDSGGNDLSLGLDQRNDNWNKVSLGLTPYLPMAYYRKRERHLCYFLIRPEVAAWSGVVFTDTNATSNDHKRGEGLEGLNLINFGIIFSIARGDKEVWKRYVQAEVLVPEDVPFDYIPKIVFVSQASMMYAEKLCSSLSHPQFSIAKRLFTDSRQAPEGAVNFSHVVEFVLTDVQVDKNMVSFSHPHKNKYSKQEHKRITLVARVNALPGTQAKIFLHPTNVRRTVEHLVKTIEFETPEEHSRRYVLSLDALSDGWYSIDYCIDIKGKDLCWASIDFEVSQ